MGEGQSPPGAGEGDRTRATDKGHSPGEMGRGLPRDHFMALLWLC